MLFCNDNFSLVLATENPRVGGSNPPPGTIQNLGNTAFFPSSCGKPPKV